MSRTFIDHKHTPEHCTLADMATMKGEPPTPTFITDCENYFHQFVKPVREAKDQSPICFHCGEHLTGVMAMLGRGGFEWGITHGEGHCAGCKWPARAHHFAKNAMGEDLFTLRNFVLSYHPDFVRRASHDEI